MLRSGSNHKRKRLVLSKACRFIRNFLTLTTISCHCISNKASHTNKGDRINCKIGYCSNTYVNRVYVTITVTINGIVRDCAPQKHEYQDYKNGRWYPKTEIHEVYEEGCVDKGDTGERVTSTKYDMS